VSLEFTRILLNSNRMSVAERPIRVMHIASGDLWAGAEAQVAALVGELARFPGLELASVVLNEGELAARLRTSNVETRIVPESQFTSWTIYRQLAAIMRTWRPDVVHTHRQKENILGAVAARAVGVRACVRTTHGAAEFTPPAWQPHKLALRHLDAWVAGHLQQRVVAVSDDLGRKLTHDLPRAMICVIPNGIDAESVRRLAVPPVPLPNNILHVAIIGRLVPVKRVDLFLRAAAAIMRSGHGHYQFHVIGTGPLRKDLERQAVELGISRNCIFHGFRPDVLSLLAGMACMVLTSDHEGLPMTALEARALGVPVVAHAVGGLVSLLRDDSDCRLVRTQTVHEVARAILEVASVKGPERSLSRLPARYTIGQTSVQYADLYHALTRACGEAVMQ
jgi:L-malate glycosyltransferase